MRCSVKHCVPNEVNSKLAVVAHTCHPSTWRLRQEDCCEFKATLGYMARGQTRKHTEILFKNECMRHIKEVSSIPYSVLLA